MILWITFIVSASFIVGAGIKLAFYGDIIAEKSGLGRTIVGLLLISFATSLPEMVTAVRSAMLGNPDLVMGNMFGSNSHRFFGNTVCDERSLYNQCCIFRIAEQRHAWLNYHYLSFRNNQLTKYIGTMC